MSKLQTVILEALAKRIEFAPNENQQQNLTAESRFFADATGSVILDKVSNLIDIESLARQIAIVDKSNADFVAVYALQKIRKMVYSIANNSKSFIDGYSNSILHNMCRLQSEITNKSAQVALSKSVEYTEFDKQQSVKRLVNVAASTASTQASSTRMMLRVLNIATVNKNKNSDEFTFRDTEIAKVIISYYQK